MEQNYNLYFYRLANNYPCITRTENIDFVKLYNKDRQKLRKQRTKNVKMKNHNQ